MRDEFYIAVGGDVRWDSVLGENMDDEELCKFLRGNCVMGRNEDRLLG